MKIVVGKNPTVVVRSDCPDCAQPDAVTKLSRVTNVCVRCGNTQRIEWEAPIEVVDSVTVIDSSGMSRLVQGPFGLLKLET
jgi:hypothetical protein